MSKVDCAFLIMELEGRSAHSVAALPVDGDRLRRLPELLGERLQIRIVRNGVAGFAQQGAPPQLGVRADEHVEDSGGIGVGWRRVRADRLVQPREQQFCETRSSEGGQQDVAEPSEIGTL